MIDLSEENVYQQTGIKLAIYSFLQAEAKQDKAIEEKCKTTSKTIEGLLKYLKIRAKGVEEDGIASIEAETCFFWSKRYLLNDELNYEGEQNV